ncbi:class I SAM-dependent methyltransferase [Williamsia limnetica]|nr:methyltransferase domain-containing protein [Williamsia limnetica]
MNEPNIEGRSARRPLQNVRQAIERILPHQSARRRLADAADYWTDDTTAAWAANSHWRGGLDIEDWTRLGTEHLEMFRTFAKALGVAPNPKLMIEWGCGGGANAVAFAPHVGRLLVADVSAPSVAETIRQVAAVCSTPVGGIEVDIASPATAAAGLEDQCDLFLCVYVLELVPSQQDAMEIIEIAERLLVSGGVALIQVKYHTTSRWTRGRRRNYHRNLANMTTFGIDEFWTAATERGLTAKLVTLVPENALDRRYAYLALQKP